MKYIEKTQYKSIYKEVDKKDLVYKISILIGCIKARLKLIFYVGPLGLNKEESYENTA